MCKSSGGPGIRVAIQGQWSWFTIMWHSSANCYRYPHTCSPFNNGDQSSLCLCIKAFARMIGGTDVAIVGAGPYGRCCASVRVGIKFRMFGDPMHLLAGTHIKGTSSLFNPSFPQSCANQVSDTPMLEEFTAYGFVFHRCLRHASRTRSWRSENAQNPC
jgi:hypothetical protein